MNNQSKSYKAKQILDITGSVTFYNDGELCQLYNSFVSLVTIVQDSQITHRKYQHALLGPTRPSVPSFVPVGVDKQVDDLKEFI